MSHHIWLISPICRRENWGSKEWNDCPVIMFLFTAPLTNIIENHPNGGLGSNHMKPGTLHPLTVSQPLPHHQLQFPWQ
jgi:hypothetical protein